MKTTEIPTTQTGFSLLQIMLAVAIVAVLAGIAVPAYQDSVVRSRVVEALEFADGARVKVEEALMTGHKAPQDLLDASGRSVDMMTALTWVEAPSGGYILPEMDLPGLGKRKAFALVLSDAGNGAHWKCVNAAKMNYPDALAEKYLPASCRGDGSKVASSPVKPQSRPLPQTNAGGAATSDAANLPQPNCAPGHEAVLAQDNSGKEILACFKNCPAGTIRDSLNFTKCNPVAPQPKLNSGGQASTGDASTLPQPNCAPGHEAVLAEDSSGKEILACFKNCPAGTIRDPLNFTKCNPVAPQPKLNSGGQASTGDASTLPQPNCAPGHEAVLAEDSSGKEILACFKKCPAGTIRDSLNFTKCNAAAP